MVTMVGTEAELQDTLDNLLQLDLDAVEGYDLAIGNVQASDIREQLEQFKADHVRHADELSALLSEMGRKPSTGPGTRQIIPNDPVVAASTVGDKSILEKLRTSEEDTNTAYERAVEMAGGHDKAERTLRKGLEDERRHRDWIQSKLAKL